MDKSGQRRYKFFYAVNGARVHERQRSLRGLLCVMLWPCWPYCPCVGEAEAPRLPGPHRRSRRKKVRRAGRSSCACLRRSLRSRRHRPPRRRRRPRGERRVRPPSRRLMRRARPAAARPRRRPCRRTSARPPPPPPPVQCRQRGLGLSDGTADGPPLLRHPAHRHL